ncbi:MAG: recombinase family protein [Xanthobacteraceae bacterium]
MKSTKRVAIYLRVSTTGQTTDNQRRELEAVAEQRSWQVVGVYEDAGISGARGRDRRPGFDRLLKDATAGKFDILAAWSVDRLGRSLQDLVGFLGELKALGRDLYLHRQSLDTSTPSGRAMFQMLGVFAEFEREIIRERVNAGLARARANGVKLGRRRVSRKIEERIRALRSDGLGMLKISKSLGVGTSVVQRVLGTWRNRFDDPSARLLADVFNTSRRSGAGRNDGQGFHARLLDDPFCGAVSWHPTGAA